MVSVTHLAVTGRKITRTDYNTTEHTVSGTPNKYLGFDSDGNLEEKNAPSGGGSQAKVNLADYLDAERVPWVTDDLPAFEAALDAIGTEGGSLFIPQGKYYCSAAVNVHCLVDIFGEGNGSWILFGNNCNGFVFNYTSTHDDEGGLTGQGNSGGSSIRNLMLWGGNVNVNGSGTITSYAAGDSTTGCGIRVRAPSITISRVTVNFFGGDGFNVNGTAGAGGYTDGNANTFRMEYCESYYNGGYGFYVGGSDANAGVVMCCSAFENAGCGFVDWSFLGNTWIQCHARDNGRGNPVISGGPCGTCFYEGLSYYPVADKLTEAATTTPGTDETVWVRRDLLAFKDWTEGQTWLIAGAYATNPGNVNARNVFIGCYAESGQSPVQSCYPTIFLGGLLEEVNFHEPTTSQAAIWLHANQGYLQAKYYRASATGDTFGEPNAWSKHIRGDATISLADVYTGSITFDHSTLGRFITMFGEDDGYRAGSTSIPNLRVGQAGGNDLAGRLIQYISAQSDLDGETLTAGERFYWAAPTDGGSEGLVVTTGGTGGSTAALTAFGVVGGVQAAAQADAAALTSVDGANAAAAPTQAEFNALVAEFNKLRTDLGATRTALNGALASLRTAKLMAT